MDTEKKPDNQQAFPYQYLDGYGEVQTVHGMTLRDYFANSAMQVILKHQLDRGGHLAKGFANHCVTEMAYNVADDMLKQREI